MEEQLNCAKRELSEKQEELAQQQAELEQKQSEKEAELQSLSEELDRRAEELAHQQRQFAEHQEEWNTQQQLQLATNCELSSETFATHSELEAKTRELEREHRLTKRLRSELEADRACTGSSTVSPE
jgi:chromosome segregation ATPase